MVVQFYILSLLRCPQVIQFLICRVEACHHSWVRTNDNSFSRRCTVRAWRISAQGQSNRTRWNSWSWRSEQRRVPLRWLKWLIISVKTQEWLQDGKVTYAICRRSKWRVKSRCETWGYNKFIEQKDNNNESTKVIPALGESAIVRGVGDNLGETVTRQLRIVTCCDQAWRAYMRGKSVLVSLYPHLPP